MIYTISSASSRPGATSSAGYAAMDQRRAPKVLLTLDDERRAD
jgi:hypothetical protein